MGTASPRDKRSLDAVLSVRDLVVRLPSRDGHVGVVDGISFDVKPGEIFGLAGESGSGKSISVLALLGLLPRGSIVKGSAIFQGRDLLSISEAELQKIRGRDLSLLLQDPHASLHPMLTVQTLMTEHMVQHLEIDSRAARARAIDLLSRVHIPDPAGSMQAYPHQFSGGMKQRIAIAIALACGPKLLIADEPTTGLDVTVQAGILRLLNELRTRQQLSIIFITHDLGVMSAIADSVTVLYGGRIVESGSRSDVFMRPRHPYTKALLEALPDPIRPDAALIPIPGAPERPGRQPPGCRFHPRCPFAIDACTQVLPELVRVDQTNHMHACIVDPFRSDRMADDASLRE